VTLKASLEQTHIVAHSSSFLSSIAIVLNTHTLVLTLSLFSIAMSSSSSPVLVFGATGNIASSLVHQLHKSGVPVVATVRDTAKAKAKLPSGVQVVQVDFKDVASVKQAVVSSGAKRAFGVLDLISPENLDALKSAGLTHLVYISTSVMGLPTEPMALQQWQTGLEGAVKDSGLTYSILRGEAFMSNCKQQQHTQPCSYRLRPTSCTAVAYFSLPAATHFQPLHDTSGFYAEQPSTGSGSSTVLARCYCHIRTCPCAM